MADFADNYTPVIKLNYSSAGINHSLQIRGARGSFSEGNFTNYLTKLGLILNDLEPIIYTDFTIIDAQMRLEDTDIFLPVSVPFTVTGGATIGTRPNSQAATAAHFACKDSLGNLGGFYLFGLSYAAGQGLVTSDWILSSTEDENLEAAINQLTETAPVFTTIAGRTDTRWRTRVTLKVNDKILKLFRGGA